MTSLMVSPAVFNASRRAATLAWLRRPPISLSRFAAHASSDAGNNNVAVKKIMGQYETAATTEPGHFKQTQENKVASKESDSVAAAAAATAGDDLEASHEKQGIIHFKAKKNEGLETREDTSQEYLLAHPIWSEKEVENVDITHKQPEVLSDKLAYYSVMFLRKSFDIASGYTIGKNFSGLDERSVLTRCLFLETVAGVPGFAAAMIRHLHSLRRMQRDHGWIHTLLEEAENERMHLMTFLQLRKPGPMFRLSVILAQWTFTAFFMTAYLISPRYCHRFVAYLEEQAVVTYSHILEEIDNGNLPMWKRLPAPEIAVTYWQLPKDAMMRDVILAIRADEAHHRLVNHTLSSMNLRQRNPFKKGE